MPVRRRRLGPVHAARARRAAAAAAALLGMALPAALSPAQAPDLADLELVAQGFNRPVQVLFDPADDRRMLVVEKNGFVRVVYDGQTLPEPFLNLSSLVVPSGARGLLSLAPAPDYARSGRFYVKYTAPVVQGESLDIVIARYRVSDDPDRADQDSGEVILTSPAPWQAHYGGYMSFGAGGMLWTVLGDPAPAKNPSTIPQQLDHLGGKMLRIDVSPQQGYAIPQDNPFVGVPGAREEIWSLGHRNPWRWTFDALTGDLYLADVGWNRWEEVNFVPRADRGDPGGQNFGWPCIEGPECTGLGGCDCNDPALTAPAHWYAHDDDGGLSITGGIVYRGDDIPRWRGRYFFADFISNRLWSLRMVDGVATDVVDHSADLAGGGIAPNAVVSFAEDADGEMYIVDHAGRIVRVRAEYHPADWNLDGLVDGGDFLAFLADFFAGSADFTGDNRVDGGDFLGFLAVFFS